jgi:hypothetical protein
MKPIKLSKAPAIIMAGIGLLAIATNAMAYSKSTCLGEELKWSSNSKSLEANSTSFPSGTWFNGVSDGVAKFNLNPSKFRYSVFSSGGGVSRGNGQSEIWGSTSADVLQGFPAIAYSWWTCFWFFGDHVSMDEVDIAFDYGSPWKWTTSTDKKKLLRYSDTATDLRPLQTTTAHEVGHGAKLNHVNTEYNVMGTDFEHIHVNGTTARAYAGEDVADGMVDLYGARSGSWEDLGVVHWRYSGASGEYSDHTKTVIRNSAGGALPTFTITDPGTTRETAYRVSPGQTIRVQFTYENNGKTRQPSSRVGFYVSSNHLITTWDTRIGGVTLDLGRNNVYTRTDTVTLPSTLQTNRTYWVGAIIDENNTIGEAVEWNNATYIPIRVQ